MRVKSVKLISTEQELAATISRHTGKSRADSTVIAQQILNGAAVVLEDDWALEQDLKDLGVKF